MVSEVGEVYVKLAVVVHVDELVCESFLEEVERKKSARKLQFMSERASKEPGRRREHGVARQKSMQAKLAQGRANGAHHSLVRLEDGESETLRDEPERNAARRTRRLRRLKPKSLADLAQRDPVELYVIPRILTDICVEFLSQFWQSRTPCSGLNPPDLVASHGAQ